MSGAGPGKGGHGPNSTVCPVSLAIIDVCKIVYMSVFAEMKHQTRGKWDLSSFAKTKVGTYMYICHVLHEVLLVLVEGHLIFLMSDHVGRLEVRLQFHKFMSR